MCSPDAATPALCAAQESVGLPLRVRGDHREVSEADVKPTSAANDPRLGPPPLPPCPDCHRLRDEVESSVREPDPWPIIEWLQENMPRALELCPYKVKR